MWMRLATPLDDSDVLGNVFQEKENPFEKAGNAAMDKVKELASKGKLYLRDFARSRHFHKVEMEGEELKLGDQHEMKLRNRDTDPVLGALMWLSRTYFKWVGLDRISNWFDQKLQRRSGLVEMDDRYKEEYDSLSDDEKQELKDLRKQEKQEAKAQKKLEKLEKELEKAREELNQIQGKNTPKEKGEMDAPLNQTPELEQQNNTMQPTLLGDQPVQEQKKEQPTRTDNLVSEHVAEQEILGEKREKKETKEEKKEERDIASEKEKINQIIFNGKEYTKENMQELPEIVRAAVLIIQQYIAQLEAMERGNRQRNQEQPTEAMENTQKPVQEESAQKEGTLIDLDDFQQNTAETPEAVSTVNTKELEEIFNNANQPKAEEAEPQQQEGTLIDLDDFQQNTAETPEAVSTVNTKELEEIFNNANQPKAEEAEPQQLEGTLIDLDGFQQNTAENHEEFQTVDLAQLEQIFGNNGNQPEVHGEEVQVEMPAPLNDPPKVEADKVSIQERPKEQEQPTLQERLAAEKQSLDSIRNWRDHIANVLFSHEDGKEMMEQLQSIKEDLAHFSTALSCVAFGVLTQNTGGPENKQQVMDALLNGTPLGNENNSLINKGVQAYNDAVTELNAGNSGPMEKMLADAVKQLSMQATREEGLSPRNVMIARMISNAFRIAQNNNLDIPLQEDDMVMVQGAAEMGKLAQKYYNARQYLGENPVDMGSPEGRKAVNDLMAGNLADRMIQEDMADAKATPKTQILMGSGMWSVENIQTMISASATRRTIAQDHVQAILEKPDGFRAACVTKELVNELLADTLANHAEPQKELAMEKENVQELEQPELKPVQVPG